MAIDGIVRWRQVRSAAPNGREISGPVSNPSTLLQLFRTMNTNRSGEPVVDTISVTKPFLGIGPSAWMPTNWSRQRKVVQSHAHHKNDPAKRLKFITTEMINFPSYAHNANSRYSPNAQSSFVRDTWAK